MQPAAIRSVALALLMFVLALVTACMGDMPPPPKLTVTSPERGLVRGDAGNVVVKGTALPGPSGAAVSKVMVNGKPAKLEADGSFVIAVAIPEGATLIETIAYSEDGAKAIDARAAHVGELRAVGSRIDAALLATLSTDAFGLISKAASDSLKAIDVSGKIPQQSFGNSAANLKVTVDRLALADVDVALAPVEGGLSMRIEVSGLTVGAMANYDGIVVPQGSLAVGVTAEKLVISATLVVTPNGTGGFKTSVASPNVSTTALKLQASGLVGEIIQLFDENLPSVLQSAMSKAAELALEPLVNTALGALAGPKQISVLGKTIDLEASANAIQLSSRGALAGVNLAAKIAGSEVSRGYIYTPNGTPTLDVGDGLSIALSDDLLNDMLSQVHALGVMDLHLEEDFGLFDSIDIEATLPPMITANTTDGKVRVVLGDMIATVKNDGNLLVRAAINAQVDVAVERTEKADEIAIRLGNVEVFANLLDEGGSLGPEAITDAANAGVGIQIDNLDQFLVTVPVPQLAGLQIDSLALRGDNGYVVASARIR